ncbi:dockerin type I domain-containing protein [Halosimplex amylolyticum]|uniref:dockerin type I domain-containing protein n=1 Tax=Halosimplex amylolyticum TaxID=3396616 RepID=UPI003F5708A6
MGSIAIVTILVLSACAPGVVGGAELGSADFIVETQDRVDDDGNLGVDENEDDDNVYVSIQAAVDAAPNGATINVTTGVYNESVVIDKPNIALVGETGDITAGAGNSAPILDSNGVKTTAFKLTPAADNVVIEGFQVQEYQSFGVFPEVGRTKSIEGVTVRHNSFTDLTNAVAYLSREDGALLSNMTATKNEMSNIGYGINVVGRTGVSDIEDITIADNTIQNANYDGIQVLAFSDNATIKDVAIQDNTVDSTGQVGIEVETSDMDSIVRSVTIEDNDVTAANSGVGLISRSGGEIASIDVFHNELTNNEQGVYVNAETTSAVAIHYNDLGGNTKYGVNTSGSDILSAENNWWGTADGPAVDSNPDGPRDRVSENVSYEPFLTRTVEVEDAKAPISETATVDVTADAANVAGYELRVEFNESALEVTDVVGADLADPTVNVDNENGVVTFTQAETQGIDKPTLARIKFNVTAAGESNVTVDSSESALFDEDAASISSLSYEKGVVVNDEPGDGDVNGDGQINAGDVVLLQRYIVGDDVSIDEEAADVDGDGDIDAGDVLLVQQRIVDG